MDGFGDMGGWGMAFGGIMMLFWVVAIVALVVFLVRWFGKNTNEASNGDAMALLDQRYARGEIETSDYKERQQILRSAG